MKNSQLTLLKITFKRWKQIVLHWDLWAAIAGAVGIWFIVNTETDAGRLIWLMVMGAGVALSVVVAGLAYVLNSIRDEFAQFVATTRPDSDAETLWPFWFSIWLFIIVLAGGVASVATIDQLSLPFRRSLVSAVTFFFLWSIFNIISLVFFAYKMARVRDFFYNKLRNGTDSEIALETKNSEVSDKA